MKLALEPPVPSVRSMTLTFEHDGARETFRLMQARKRVADGDRAVTVLLEPREARGIAFLVSEPSSAGAVEWIYVPVVRRVRKLVPAESYHSFLDTDFTYGDLGLVSRDTTNELRGTESVDGRTAYEVESVPRPTVKRWYYDRFLTWIDAETLLPIRREYRSPAGDLFKVETFGTVTRIDGIPTPLAIRMTTIGAGTTTTIDVGSVTYDAEVPDELFDPENLRGVAEDPFWTRTPLERSSVGSSPTTKGEKR